MGFSLTCGVVRCGDQRLDVKLAFAFSSHGEELVIRVSGMCLLVAELPVYIDSP